MEDDPDQVELTLRIIESHPATGRVATKQSLASTINWLEAAETQLPELILLDLDLGDEQGLDVLDHLRDRPTTEFVPVVILTTSSSPEDMREAYRRGANGYLTRALDYRVLEDQVQAALDFWIEANRAPTI